MERLIELHTQAAALMDALLRMRKRWDMALDDRALHLQVAPDLVAKDERLADTRLRGCKRIWLRYTDTLRRINNLDFQLSFT